MSSFAVSDEALLPLAVVDDDRSVLKSLARLLGAHGLEAQTFGSPAEFLEAYSPERIGCVILDLTMPSLSGIDVQRVLHERGGSPPILFLAGTGGVREAVRTIREGAVEFLTKPVDEDTLLAAIHNALERERVERAARMAIIDIHRRLRSLTPREREVLEHVVRGQLNKQIAADLGIALGTIKLHRARIMEKMRVESVADLVRQAMRVDIISG